MKILILLSLIGIISQYYEADFLHTHYQVDKYSIQFLITTFLTSIAIFLLSIFINIRENIISNWGRKYSLFIYLYHFYTYFLISRIEYRLLSNHGENYSLFSPILCFALTLILGVMLNKFFNQIFNFLNGKFK